VQEIHSSGDVIYALGKREAAVFAPGCPAIGIYMRLSASSNAVKANNYYGFIDPFERLGDRRS
jgi:hypothetical protein